MSFPGRYSHPIYNSYLSGSQSQAGPLHVAQNKMDFKADEPKENNALLYRLKGYMGKKGQIYGDEWKIDFWW